MTKPLIQHFASAQFLDRLDEVLIFVAAPRFDMGSLNKRIGLLVLLLKFEEALPQAIPFNVVFCFS